MECQVVDLLGVDAISRGQRSVDNLTLDCIYRQFTLGCSGNTRRFRHTGRGVTIDGRRFGLAKTIYPADG